MHSISRSLHRHARLKIRAAAGSALPRRRFQVTEAGAAVSSPVASAAAAGPSNVPSQVVFPHSMSGVQIPAPLHPDYRSTALSQHSIYPASSTLEQLALLEVCLATGNISRARKVYAAIQDMYKQEFSSSSEQYDDFDPSSGQWRRRLQFSEVIPVAIHAQFLRAYFRQAIVQDNAKTLKGSKLKKRAAVSQAWEWFEMLLREESVYGRLDNAAWAVMLKGLVATKFTNPNLEAIDPAAPHLKPISHLYTLLRENGRSLYTILQDSIFSHAGPAGLNDHSALDVCEELAAVLADRGETDALAEVDKVKQDLLDGVRLTGDPELQATADNQSLQEESTSASSSRSVPERLQPAKRSESENIPFKLDSLVANLEAINGHRRVSQDPYVRQDLLEESGYDAALWQSMHGRDKLEQIGRGTDVRMKGGILQEHMSRWLEALAASLEEQIQSVNERRVSSRKRSEFFEGEEDVLQLLSLVSPEQVAHITIVEMMRAVSHASGIADGVRAARAVIQIGRAIEDEYGAEAWKTLYPDLYDNAMKQAAETARKTYAVRHFMQEQGIAAGAAKEARLQGYGDEADDLLKIEDADERRLKLEARKRALPWTQKMRARVGGLLTKLLLDVAYVKRTAIKNDESGEVVMQKQPAFWQSYQFLRSQKVGVIKLNPVIADRMDKDYVGSVAFPRYLPMLVKPKPWTGWSSGGYRLHPTPVMRTKDSPEQERYVRLAAEHGQMKDVFAALDALGSTPWRINKPIYDVITKVWNSGEALGEIPVDNAEMKIPAPPQPTAEELSELSYKQAYKAQLSEVRQERAKAHSQRCTLNYKLEIARAYLDETFYFPHNIDFRGRAYPIPPNLSHIGDDITRGLLEFAEGRPLGKRGLSWLYVHVANTAGFDKASLDDRENFAKNKIDEIMDSADRPLDGNMWWHQASDPWQCLAACVEITNALRSPNPEEFISHLPVQQDGTCNGLQHYAALGGDRTGAEQVNLAVGEKPSDVYTAVADLVNKEIEQDIKAWDDCKTKLGSESQVENSSQAEAARHTSAQDIANKEVERRGQVASVLHGKVTRKVVKQTVMTTVYGVTFVGAKRQIQRQLRDRGDISHEWQYSAANYLAEKVLTSIGDLFKGASSIQLWLSICARLIGKSILPQPGKSFAEQFSKPMASVIWTTPLGLPVAQPYRKMKKAQVKTALQSVFITDPNMPSAVDARAQATAFPPNYVHSLDATHMMMTAIECKRRGLAFASVHDSYWTHACDVDEMSAALRDCFIKLHSRDLLGELRSGFQERYRGYVVRKGGTRPSHLKKPNKHSAIYGTSSIQKIAQASRKAAKSVEQGLEKALDNSSNSIVMDVDSLAAEYGVSALPPLAIARDERLLKELQEAEKKAGVSEKSEAQMELEEEKMFAMEEGLNIEDGVADSPEDVVYDGKALEESLATSEMTVETAASSDEVVPVPSPPQTIPNRKNSKIQVYDLSSTFPEIPPRGDFDLETIRDSPYFFS